MYTYIHTHIYIYTQQTHRHTHTHTYTHKLMQLTTPAFKSTSAPPSSTLANSSTVTSLISF